MPSSVGAGAGLGDAGAAALPPPEPLHELSPKNVIIKDKAK